MTVDETLELARSYGVEIILNEAGESYRRKLVRA